jgi:hypothetical protein
LLEIGFQEALSSFTGRVGQLTGAR